MFIMFYSTFTRHETCYLYLQKSVRNLKILTSQFLFYRFFSFSNSRIVNNNHFSEWSQTWSINSFNCRICFKNVKIDRSNETLQKTVFSNLHTIFFELVCSHHHFRLRLDSRFFHRDQFHQFCLFLSSMSQFC